MADKTEDEGGSNVKYVIIGLLFVALAVGIWIAVSGDGDQVTVGAPDAGPPPRPPPVDDLEIPDPEPDAGPEVDAGQPGPAKTKIVYRYVRGDWDCNGSIDQSAASGVINSYQRQVRNCYERQLKQNHTLQGNVSLTLRIGPEGTVTGARVGGSLQDPVVFACVRNLASSWRFPQPSGGCVVVSQSFNMTPQQ